MTQSDFASTGALASTPTIVAAAAAIENRCLVVDARVNLNTVGGL
jgi:hypothetical protein